MVDEAKLLRRLRDGAPGALERAIQLYTPYLSAVIFRAGGGGLPPEDQEELLADVFTALWRNAAQLDPEKGSVRVYLAAAARNGVYKRLRDRRETVSLEALAESGAEPAAADPDRLSLWDAVAGLGEEDCELFVRFYRYGQSLREIAAATGLKLSAVKSRLSRGRQKLKQILSDAEGSE
jgi:RNA polymerase sigma-70 factor (ECF subfamily)